VVVLRLDVLVVGGLVLGADVDAGGASGRSKEEETRSAVRMDWDWDGSEDAGSDESTA
jgi:hypothetical protein